MKYYILSFVTIVLALSFRCEALDLKASGRNFTINGQKKFLYGISLFDAVHIKRSDLLWIKDHGFNLIRIGVHWPFNGKSPMKADGSFSQNCLNQYAEYSASCEEFLKGLVSYADSLGIVIDLSVFDYSNSINFKEAAKSLARLTLTMPNVFVDLINEHNVRPEKPHSDIRVWVSEFKRINNKTLVFASNTHFVDRNENLDSSGIRDEESLGMDLLGPHLFRSSDWADKIPSRLQKIFSVSSRPIYLQEEHRRGWQGADMSNAVLAKAAKNAKSAGAAGYIFHTDSGFNLSPTICFKSGLDAEELRAIDSLKNGF